MAVKNKLAVEVKVMPKIALCVYGGFKEATRQYLPQFNGATPNGGWMVIGGLVGKGTLATYRISSRVMVASLQYQ